MYTTMTLARSALVSAVKDGGSRSSESLGLGGSCFSAIS